MVLSKTEIIVDLTKGSTEKDWLAMQGEGALAPYPP